MKYIDLEFMKKILFFKRGIIEVILIPEEIMLTIWCTISKAESVLCLAFFLG